MTTIDYTSTDDVKTLVSQSGDHNGVLIALEPPVKTTDPDSVQVHLVRRDTQGAVTSVGRLVLHPDTWAELQDLYPTLKEETTDVTPAETEADAETPDAPTSQKKTRKASSKE